MACNIIASDSFEGDLDEIVDYLKNAQGSLNAARRFLEETTDAVALIAEFPDIHAVSRKPILHDGGYREHYTHSHVIVYRIVDEGVFLARIFHQRQDYMRLLGDESAD